MRNNSNRLSAISCQPAALKKSWDGLWASHRKLAAAWTVILLFCALTPSFGQQLTSGADFLKIDSGARSEGMGGAFTAVADDVNALTWNPAGVALLSRPEVGYLHMLYLSDIGYNFGGIALPLPAGEDTWGLGAGIVNLGTPTFDSTEGLAPSVSAGSNALFASVALRLKNVISFGVTGKYILQTIAGYNSAAFGGDAGMLWTPTDRLRVGLGVFNFGQQVQFISAADPLPMTGRLGLAYQLIDSPHNSLLLAVDNGYQFASRSYIGAVGGEYWYDKTLALRAGYTGDAYQQHWTAGVGLNVGVAQLDYAYAPIGTLGNTHRLSLIVRFGPEGPGGLAAPTGFTVKPRDGGVSLKWVPVPSSSVVGYNIYVKKPGADGLTLVTKHPLNDTSVKLNRLVNGQNYTFAVASVSAAGRESGLVQLSAVPGEPNPGVQGLLAPTGFKANLNGEGFDLVWDASASPDFAGNNLYIADDQGKAGKKLNAQPVTGNRITLKNVNPTRTYRFLLTAVGKSGVESPASPVLTVSLADLKKAVLASLLPPAHFALQTKDGKAYLTWDASSVAAKYNLYLSHDGNSYKLLTKDGLAQTHATLGPLKAGTTYYFGITSVTAGGQESNRAVQSLKL